MQRLIRIAFLGILISLFFCRGSFAQRFNYSDEMRALADSIQSNFYQPSINYYKESISPRGNAKKVSYLWPLCAMFEASNEMGAVTGNYQPFNNVFLIIGKYYDKQPPSPAYASYSMEFGGGSRFYDDNQWIGITAMDAYSRTKDKHWLAVGKDIYKFMMTGFDTLAGGGLYWQEDRKNTKNTCSNGPGILLALQLYKSTSNKVYLKTAKELYEWASNTLETPEGLFHDNINVSNKKVDGRLYSYNTGTMLQSGVLLYELTKDKKYLEKATKSAAAAANYFLAGEAFKDSWWFNAVLLRGYQQLLQYNQDSTFIDAFRKALNKEIIRNRGADGHWQLNKRRNLVDYGGLLECLARFAQLQEKGILH